MPHHILSWEQRLEYTVGELVLNNWTAYPAFSTDIETLEKLRNEVKFRERGEQGLGRNSENLYTPPGLT